MGPVPFGAMWIAPVVWKCGLGCWLQRRCGVGLLAHLGRARTAEISDRRLATHPDSRGSSQLRYSMMPSGDMASPGDCDLLPYSSKPSKGG